MPSDKEIRDEVQKFLARDESRNPILVALEDALEHARYHRHGPFRKRPPRPPAPPTKGGDSKKAPKKKKELADA